MTRRRKLLFLLVLAPLALVALVVVAALTPAVQTAVARKALAGQGTVERVAVGVGGAQITGLTLEQPGVKIVLPSFRADLPLLSAAGGSIKLSALVAHDVVIDYDPVAAAVHAATNPPAAKPPTTPQPFAGILNAVELPALTADGVDLAGVLRVGGPTPFTARFTLTGGGVAAGKEGRLELKITTEVSGSDVTMAFALLPALDAAGQLSALGVTLDATAKGFPLKKSATLRGEIAIARDGAGESWRARLIAADKTLVELDTRWSPGAAALPGKWKLDVTDADIAPFSPRPALPTLRLTGAGDLTLTDGERLNLSGDLRAAADGVESLDLPELGALALATSFDLAASATEAKVNAFRLEVAAASAPVLTVDARQAFTYDLATGKVASARATGDLLAVRLLAVPAAWVKLFVPELTLGQPSGGAWSVRPDGDGIAIDATEPFVLSGVRYGTDAAPLLALDALRVEGMRVRQGPAGLEASVDKLRLVAKGVDLVTLKANATQKTGAPLAAHAEISAQLAALADQPALHGQTRLSAGRALVIVDATAGETTEAIAELRLTGLRAAGAGDLPDVFVQADVKQDAAGALTLRLPLSVTSRAPQRTSDLELSATVTPPTAGPAPTRHVVAKLLSQTLHLPDLQVFAAIAAETAPAKPAPAPVEPAPPADAPLWAGVTGELDIVLARIVYAPGVEFVNTGGHVALTKNALSLERLRSLVGTGGSIDLNGALRWLDSTRGYALNAEVAGADLAAGPLLKALNPSASVPLEGTYALAGTVTGEGVDPAAAAQAAAVDLRLTGRKGVIRSLDFDTNRYARIGSGAAGVAGLLGALSGNAELAEKGAMVTALNNVVRTLTNLAYDELSLAVTRAADGAVEIGELRLASPTFRIDGGGGLGNLAGRSLWQQPLKLNLQLGAREALARDFTTLRILKPLPANAPAGDYAALVEPVTLDGTLSKISTAQFTRLLVRHLVSQ